MPSGEKPLSSLVKRILDEYDARVGRMEIHLPRTPTQQDSVTQKPRASAKENITRPRATRPVQGPVAKPATMPQEPLTPVSRSRGELFKKPHYETRKVFKKTWPQQIALTVQVALGVFLGMTIAKFVPEQEWQARVEPPNMPEPPAPVKITKKIEPPPPPPPPAKKPVAKKKKPPPAPKPRVKKPKPVVEKSPPKAAVKKPEVIQPKAPPVATGKIEATMKIPFPAQWPRGLIVKGFYMATVDRRSGKLVVIDPNKSPARKKYIFPNFSAEGITSNGSDFWSIDSTLKKIYLHDNKNFLLRASFPSAGITPSAIHSDGNFIWVSDTAAKQVSRYSFDGKNLNLIASHPIIEADPIALHRHGRDLWILDGRTLIIGRYRVGSDLKRTGSANLTTVVPKDAMIRGFVIDGKYLWVLTQGPTYLHRIDLRKLQF